MPEGHHDVDDDGDEEEDDDNIVQTCKLRQVLQICVS